MKYLTFFLVLICALNSILHALPCHSNGKTNAAVSFVEMIEQMSSTDTAMTEAIDPCYNCAANCALHCVINVKVSNFPDFNQCAIECGDERCPDCVT